MSHGSSVRLFTLGLLGFSVLFLTQLSAFAQDTSAPYLLQSSTGNLDAKRTDQASTVNVQRFSPPVFDFGTRKNSVARIGINDSLDDVGDGQVSSVPPNNNSSKYVPMSSGEKARFAFHRAFLLPSPYIFSAAGAAITEWREGNSPHKTAGDRAADGLSWWAIKFGTYSSTTLLARGAFPILLHQDPRWFSSGKQGFKQRAWYAASRVIFTKGDNGQQQLNYSLWAGTLGGAALTNIWDRNTPRATRIGVGPTFSRFGTSLGFDALANVVLKEYGPDLKKKFLHK